MKRFFVVTMAVAAMFAVSCEKNNPDNLDVQDLDLIGSPTWIKLTKAQQEMTGGINDFAYDLYKEVYEKKDIFVSPFSVSLALSMAATGASGNTEAQFLKTLGFEGRTSRDIDEYYSMVMKNMASADPGTALSIANAIWSNKGISLKEQFIDDCGKYFDSTAESVDFSDPATLKKLNDWVYDHTNGKIDKMFDQLDPGSAAVLANALHFKAEWPFDFTRSGKRMLAKVKTTYFEGDKCTGVVLPYGNGSFYMRIILPSGKHSLKDVVNGMDTFDYTRVETAVVSLDMPVFSFSYKNFLNDALKNLGITDAFDPRLADFSRMADVPLCVGRVLHKTFVDVNENGTEAAAISAIDMKVSSAGPDTSVPREISFKVDDDFLFEIIDRGSGLTIFIGQHLL